MDEPTWWTYIRSVAHTEVLQPIADAAGVSTPQASRWKSGQNKPDADKLVRIARHYQQPPVAALIAGGYLTKEEAHAVVEIQRGAGDLTDEELLEEVQRRMKELRNAVEASQKSSTSETGHQNQEGGSVNNPKSWPPGNGWPTDDQTTMGSGEDAQDA